MRLKSMPDTGYKLNLGLSLEFSLKLNKSFVLHFSIPLLIWILKILQRYYGVKIVPRFSFSKWIVQMSAFFVHMTDSLAYWMLIILNTVTLNKISHEGGYSLSLNPSIKMIQVLTQMTQKIWFQFVKRWSKSWLP